MTDSYTVHEGKAHAGARMVPLGTHMKSLSVLRHAVAVAVAVAVVSERRRWIRIGACEPPTML
jgi:hypothetical protein